MGVPVLGSPCANGFNMLGSMLRPPPLRHPFPISLLNPIEGAFWRITTQMEITLFQDFDEAVGIISGGRL